jgi:hypothetical protein
MPLKLHNFKGCYRCPLTTKDGLPCYTDESMSWVNVVVTFTAHQFIYSSGKNLKTFNRGDVVDGKAMIKHGVIYCIKAYSTIIPSYEYQIDLKGINVKVPQTGQRTKIVKVNVPGGRGLGM